MKTQIFEAIVETIKAVPPGKVATYGQVARWAGFPGQSRQVARILHSSSKKYELPWHRIINAQGKISLPEPGYSRQKELLEEEGISFSETDTVSLEDFGMERVRFGVSEA